MSISYLLLGSQVLQQVVSYVTSESGQAKHIPVMPVWYLGPLKRFVTLATAHSATACPRELLECFHLMISVVQRYSDAELAVICVRVA